MYILAIIEGRLEEKTIMVVIKEKENSFMRETRRFGLITIVAVSGLLSGESNKIVEVILNTGKLFLQ